MIPTTNRVALLDMWRLSKLSNRGTPSHVAYKKYMKYMNAICECIEEVLMEGHYVYLPNRFGCIRLQKFKPNNKLPDWHKTRALWDKDPMAKENKVQIWVDSSETSGWWVTLKWHKFNCNFKNKSLINVYRTRGFRTRAIATLRDHSKLIDSIKT